MLCLAKQTLLHISKADYSAILKNLHNHRTVTVQKLFPSFIVIIITLKDNSGDFHAAMIHLPLGIH